MGRPQDALGGAPAVVRCRALGAAAARPTLPEPFGALARYDPNTNVTSILSSQGNGPPGAHPRQTGRRPAQLGRRCPLPVQRPETEEHDRIKPALEAIGAAGRTLQVPTSRCLAALSSKASSAPLRTAFSSSWSRSDAMAAADSGQQSQCINAAAKVLYMYVGCQRGVAGAARMAALHAMGSRWQSICRSRPAATQTVHAVHTLQPRSRPSTKCAFVHFTGRAAALATSSAEQEQPVTAVELSAARNGCVIPLFTRLYRAHKYQCQPILSVRCAPGWVEVSGRCGAGGTRHPLCTQHRLPVTKSAKEKP